MSKISERGDRLLYSSFLGGNFRSSANAITVDSTGRAFVAGSTCSADFPTTITAISPHAPGSDQANACDGFVAWFNAPGSRVEYGTYLGGSREDAVTAIALGPGGGVVYAGGYTYSKDYPVTESAPQQHLNGVANGFFSAIDVRSGKLLYSTYLGGERNDRVTTIAVTPDGPVYVGGVTESQHWPNIELTRIGKTGGSDGFIIRLDPTGKMRPAGIRIGGAGDEILASMDVDADGDVYAVGSTGSADFPVVGANRREIGGGFAMKISGERFGARQRGVVWSRRIGGHGEDALLSVSAGMPGSVFISGRSGSTDFPTTRGAVYPRLEARNDSTLVRLRAADGEIQYATFVGGSHQDASWYNDEATGVFANSNGDVYLTGCTIDDRLPVTTQAFQMRRRGNADAFALRMKFASVRPRLLRVH